ncbi:MAG TPA: (2Fe-2S)-binding protein [Acidimicrobiales bacterium]|nr:(2Fe-2S)-binding protein [Acidimicrobiales bacterium]
MSRLFRFGRAERSRQASGPVVCHCHGVRRGEIVGAIAAGAGTVGQVTEACGAGGTCGRCWPEIEALLGGAASAPHSAA